MRRLPGRGITSALRSPALKVITGIPLACAQALSPGGTSPRSARTAPATRSACPGDRGRRVRHPARSLPLVHIPVQIQPVQAGCIQPDVPSHHLRRSHRRRAGRSQSMTFHCEHPSTPFTLEDEPSGQLRAAGTRNLGGPRRSLSGTLVSKPASIWAARARRTSLPKRRASSQTSAKSRAAARSNSASSLRPASSSGASVGPAAVEEAGKSGGVSTARSATTSAVPLRMTSRQNVSLSWMRSVAQPRSRAAASSASHASGTWRGPGR